MRIRRASARRCNGSCKRSKASCPIRSVLEPATQRSRGVIVRAGARLFSAVRVTRFERAPDARSFSDSSRSHSRPCLLHQKARRLSAARPASTQHIPHAGLKQSRKFTLRLPKLVMQWLLNGQIQFFPRKSDGRQARPVAGLGVVLVADDCQRANHSNFIEALVATATSNNPIVNESTNTEVLMQKAQIAAAISAWRSRPRRSTAFSFSWQLGRREADLALSSSTR